MFKVAGVQINPIMNEVGANLKRGREFINKAAEQEVDLIVFPELWTTGYFLSEEAFWDLAETPDGSTIRQMREAAREADSAIICPFVETDGQSIYIAAAVIDRQGELRGVVRKSLLWGREQQIFTPGIMEYPVFDMEVGKIGILICYEMEFPETSRLLTLDGAEIIVCPSVWSLAASHRWDIQLPARSLDNTVFVFGVNTVGNNSCGKSKLVSPLGDILAEASDRREELLIRVIDHGALLWAREEVRYLEDFKQKLTPGGVGRIPIPNY